MKALADEYHIALVVSHHNRKSRSEDDWLDDVLGSTGLTGAAYGVLSLTRARGTHDALLCVTGRDIEEQELGLRWDPQTGLWMLLGDAREVKRSAERDEAIRLLRASGPLTPSAAADLLGKPRNTVKVLLHRMRLDGDLVADASGRYSTQK